MGARYPSIRGIGAPQNGTASLTHTIGGTSGISEPGDLILIFLESANQAFTAATGYAEVAASPQGTGTGGAANAVRLTIFYKIADGTETTYVTGDSGDHQIVCSFVIRDVDRGNPINDSAGNTAAAATALTCPAVTTTVPECLIIIAIASDRDANNTANFSNPVNVNLTTLTERIDQTFNTGQGGGFGIYTGLKGTVGSTGTTAVTQAASEETARITLAIAPLSKRVVVT